MCCRRERFEARAHLISVHHRHRPVGDNQVGHCTRCEHKSGRAVVGRQHVVTLSREGEAECVDLLGVVVYNKDGMHGGDDFWLRCGCYAVKQVYRLLRYRPPRVWALLAVRVIPGKPVMEQDRVTSKPSARESHLSASAQVHLGSESSMPKPTKVPGGGGIGPLIVSRTAPGTTSVIPR
ncbi:hypothetical protein PSAB6_450158 [Paraburkholderia sabiae]|nr:hypothetical protein PSAB6_450158 [Paraburkholderia sabiae]